MAGMGLIWTQLELNYTLTFIQYLPMLCYYKLGSYSLLGSLIEKYRVRSEIRKVAVVVR